MIANPERITGQLCCNSSSARWRLKRHCPSRPPLHRYAINRPAAPRASSVTWAAANDHKGALQWINSRRSAATSRKAEFLAQTVSFERTWDWKYESIVSNDWKMQPRD